MEINPGIVLDNHFSESAIKLFLGRKYSQNEKSVDTLRSLPRRDVLISLLMHGKFYCTRPYWLADPGVAKLKQLVDEEVIEWIPDKHYSEAFDTLSEFNVLLHQVIANAWDNTFVSIDDPNPNETITENYLHGSELQFDLDIYTNKIIYNGPIIASNLKHVGFSDDPLYVLHRPIYEKSNQLVPHTTILSDDIVNPVWASYLWTLNFDPDLSESILERFENRQDGETYLKNQALAYDSIISSIAIEKYAAQSRLPIRTSSRGGVDYVRPKIFNDEAYQLIKVQFDSLRYPVVENIEDVIRLSKDKHFEAFRTVISEYSARMRVELEEERGKVLSEFKRDLELSTRSLFVTKKWSSTVADWSFYLSIPLAITGMMLGIPLSDAVIIPVAGGAKYVSDKKRKELDWLMLGRP